MHLRSLLVKMVVMHCVKLIVALEALRAKNATETNPVSPLFPPLVAAPRLLDGDPEETQWSVGEMLPSRFFYNQLSVAGVS